MIKKTAWFFLLSCACASSACAQIGASVEDFKTGTFALAEGFTQQSTYQITDDPLYKGTYAYNFFTADKRYKLQLIADKKGKHILFEYLFYPVADDQMIALKDGSIAISFVAQSSQEAVAPEQFVSLVSEANKGKRNIKYTKAINGYTVSVTRFDTPRLTGWSIGIHK
jgi:hypothetical protein